MRHILVLALVVLGGFTFAFAQEMEIGNPEVRRQLDQIKIWQMTKDLNLPNEKAEKFFPIYNSYVNELRETAAKRRDLVKQLDQMLQQGAKDDEISKQVDKITKIDEQLAEQHKHFINSLKGILTPTEIAKYIVFEQKFQREIRDRLRAIMQQRMRGRFNRQ
jgi:Spy/CpxP family protein refolding chaperone